MQVTVKLATREGAAHISGILAGFTLLAKRGELTLRVLDARQGSPIAREALLETEIDGRTVVFDLMDGYFYNDPAAVQALFSRADVVFKRSFSAEKNRQFPGDISAKLRPLGLNYYVTCPGSPLDAERSAKSRLKQWALSTRCYPQDFEARLTRVRKKPRILFLTRLWDPEEPAVQQYPDLQAEWRQVNADRIELLHRLQSAFPAQFTGGVSDNTCARRQCPELIVPDKSLSILEGAIQASGWNNIRGDGISRMYFDALAKKYHFSLTDPWETLPEDVRSIILYGTGGEKLELHYDQPRGKGVLYQPFEGICNNVERRYKETQSDASKRELEELMAECPCPTCKGKRLKKESLAVTVGDKDIDALTRMSVVDELQWVDRLELTHQQHLIADRILKEIKSRLGFLQSVGLGYLTLSRSAGTLSGGESQRIRLATQIGSSLMGVLYILDEPSIGLHQRDNDKLLATLQNLRDLGNTLLVVEHDEDTMRAADYLIDIGPEGGRDGGRLVAAGTPEQVACVEESYTGQFLKPLLGK